MSIDFSFLKNIDLSNSDNILFFSIILIFIIIIFFIVLFLIFGMISFIKNFIERTYGVAQQHKSVIGPEQKKQELSQEDFSHHKLRINDFSMNIQSKKNEKTKGASSKEKEKNLSKEKMNEFFKGFKEDEDEKETLASKMPERFPPKVETNSLIRIRTSKKHN
jgi:preprotein translocase subunit SecF